METFNISEYIFPEMALGIILATMMIRTAVHSKVHPKWITLAVAMFAGLVEYLLHVSAEVPEPFEHWKVVNSIGVAVMGYDYLVKVVKDMLAKRNPINSK